MPRGKQFLKAVSHLGLFTMKVQHTIIASVKEEFTRPTHDLIGPGTMEWIESLFNELFNISRINFMGLKPHLLPLWYVNTIPCSHLDRFPTDVSESWKLHHVNFLHINQTVTSIVDKAMCLHSILVHLEGLGVSEKIRLTVGLVTIILN